MKLLPLLTALCLTVGCSADEAAPASSVATKDAAAPMAKADLPKVETYAALERGKQSVSGNVTSYPLNGVKYTAKSSSLVKGTQVFNPQESESGVLKGSFVVQVGSGLVFDNVEYSVALIADDTYRITPLRGNADLFELYQSLKTNDELTLVEIEIDYSRPLSQDEY
jgi:hypothetical protein